MSVYLGIDIGTSGTKTLAMDANGRVLGEACEFYPCSQPRPTWSEQDPEDWWRATVATVRAVMAKAGLKPQDVKAIGLSGQMHGAVFLDQGLKVIRPAILWNDQRTTAECADIETAVGGRDNLIQLVASPALTGFTAPKLIWLRKHEPENWQKVKHVLLPKDDVRRRLTGEFATDVSDASGTLLFDVQSRKWSDKLLQKLDIPRELLPDCFESAETTGQLTEAAAKELGLTTQCSVAGGAGDCPAGAIGNGIVKDGIASTLIGTSSVFLVHAARFTVEPQGRLHTFCHAVPGQWFMMGVNLSGGGCLQWFRNQLCTAERAAAQSEEDVYAMLTEEAARIKPGCDGLMFLPYLSGERHPHDNADARACFIGLTLSHTRAHMVRALMEGVAYNMRESMTIMEALGIPINEVRPSGGGSRSQLWREIQQNMFDKNCARVRCDQGPAFGVALLAAVSTGEFASVQEACEAIIETDKEDLFNRETARYYARSFPVFQKFYNTLTSQFKELSHLTEDEKEVVVH
jgi:xylulokinase